MTFNELHEEYMKMCDEQEDCSECKYDGNFPCQLSFGYSKGRADQKEEDNAFFNFEGAWELEKKKVRADAIEEIKELAQHYLIEMMNLENATKYGNKNVKQQDISYGTLMRYEIADCVDDFMDSLEQLKEQQ